MVLENKITKTANTLVELKRKQAIITQWPIRLAALGVSAYVFCPANGLDRHAFSRWCAGLQEPTWKNIRAVEAALLKAESLVNKSVDKP